MATKKNIKQSEYYLNLKNVVQPSYRNLIIAFVLIAVILVMAILYFTLSQATIIVTPAFNVQKVDFVAQVADKNLVNKDNLPTGRLYGELKETIVESTKEFSASTYQESGKKAGGAITIINNYSKSQPLVATTRFLTADGKLYRLVKGVTAPAGGKITAQVLADQAGANYEIGTAKLTIPGLWEGLQSQIYAETAGFKLQTTDKYLVNQATIDQATQTLKTELIDRALQQLTKGLPEGTNLTKNDLTTEVIKNSPSVKPGTEIDKFSLTMSLGVKAVIFNQEELKKIAWQSLPENYQQKNTLVKTDLESFSYEVALLDANQENLIAQIKGSYNISVAAIQIDKANLKGLSKKEAEKYLMNSGNIKNVSIYLPFWTKYLPNLADHIDLQIKQ